MKVKELIEELSKVNPEKEVEISVWDRVYHYPMTVLKIDRVLSEVHAERAEFPIYLDCSYSMFNT